MGPSRLMLSIAICFPTFFCAASPADMSVDTTAFLPEFSDDFKRGAEFVCNQPERAAKRYADMLQANCVAVDLRAGMSQHEIVSHCLGASNRSSFEAYSWLHCGSQGI